MREQVSILTQSRFFSPVFNGAIFDGPIRIYFSQSQEASAMKLYFAILARMRTKFGGLKDNFTEGAQNVFILIYPTSENFQMVFPSDQKSLIQVDRLDGDHVIGVNGPVDEAEFGRIFDYLDQVLVSVLQNSTGPDL